VGVASEKQASEQENPRQVHPARDGGDSGPGPGVG
jgi:hypothetical protein